MTDHRITFDGFDESEVEAMIETLDEGGFRTENFDTELEDSSMNPTDRHKKSIILGAMFVTIAGIVAVLEALSLLKVLDPTSFLAGVGAVLAGVWLSIMAPTESGDPA